MNICNCVVESDSIEPVTINLAVTSLSCDSGNSESLWWNWNRKCLARITTGRRRPTPTSLPAPKWSPGYCFCHRTKSHTKVAEGSQQKSFSENLIFGCFSEIYFFDFFPFFLMFFELFLDIFWKQNHNVLFVTIHESNGPLNLLHLLQICKGERKSYGIPQIVFNTIIKCFLEDNWFHPIRRSFSTFL